MHKLESHVDNNSAAYRRNAEAMQALVDDLNEHLRTARQGGPAVAQDKHRKRGKLLARERIQAVLDPGAEFLELSPLAALGLYDNEVPCAGIITGVGTVCGRAVMIVANDATVKGGAYYPLTVKKHLRAQEIAAENRLPCVYLVDSGGAYLHMQDEVFPDREHFGRIFYNQARMSALGIPQIAVVLGTCVAGGAYVPAMSDETIIVKNQGSIFLGGPPLVKAATGEIVEAEALGGGKVHCEVSGVADYLANNDAEALAMVRDSIARLPAQQDRVAVDPRPPVYAMEEIYGLIPVDARYVPDVREVIARIVDASEFDEFKARYGKTLVCGFAAIDGYLVGILANHGILFSESALKGTHFVQLCTQRGIPLVFLQNVSGFMVGSKYEHEGIAKHGAKLVMAVACAEVPKFTVIIGNSFGAGNYAMCGRAYSPRFLWMWPNARIGVMGGAIAATLLADVKRGVRPSGQEPMLDEQDRVFRQEVEQQYTTQALPYNATARLWDDGIIDPMDTRKVLSLGLRIAQQTSSRPTRYGIFRM
jgi:3-methylcrotonyl-CoA carboxylase beta subunit